MKELLPQKKSNNKTEIVDTSKKTFDHKKFGENKKTKWNDIKNKWIYNEIATHTDKLSGDLLSQLVSLYETVIY